MSMDVGSGVAVKFSRPTTPLLSRVMSSLKERVDRKLAIDEKTSDWFPAPKVAPNAAPPAPVWLVFTRHEASTDDEVELPKPSSFKLAIAGPPKASLIPIACEKTYPTRSESPAKPEKKYRPRLEVSDPLE
jgi:hypothetical protein